MAICIGVGSRSLGILGERATWLLSLKGDMASSSSMRTESKERIMPLRMEALKMLLNWRVIKRLSLGIEEC